MLHVRGDASVMANLGYSWGSHCREWGNGGWGGMGRPLDEEGEGSKWLFCANFKQDWIMAGIWVEVESYVAGIGFWTLRFVESDGLLKEEREGSLAQWMSLRRKQFPDRDGEGISLQEVLNCTVLKPSVIALICNLKYMRNWGKGGKSLETRNYNPVCGRSNLLRN